MIDQTDGLVQETAVESTQGAPELLEAMRLESLGRLAGGVAHDFNNLLAVITNYAAFVSGAIEVTLKTGDVTPLGEAVRDMAQIANAADRASVRTRQLLAFARRQHAHQRPLDVNDVVQTVVGESNKPERVAVRMRLAVNLPLVNADALQLEHVLHCLIDNAYDAMPAGGDLTVATCAAPRNGHRGVELRVVDNGLGMTESVRSQAFEPFFTTKGLGSGAGLGLATVYGIVTRAGGLIEVASARACGTTVVVWLPTIEEAGAV